MINKKLLLGIAAISIIYTGCEEKETTQIKNTPVVKKAEKKIVEITDAKTLFKKCTVCHGLNAEKQALNSSKIIKDWDASQIKEALHGYKAGTYGRNMKNAMISQVSTLSDKQIDILATYISNMK